MPVHKPFIKFGIDCCTNFQCKGYDLAKGHSGKDAAILIFLGIILSLYDKIFSRNLSFIENLQNFKDIIHIIGWIFLFIPISVYCVFNWNKAFPKPKDEGEKKIEAYAKMLNESEKSKAVKYQTYLILSFLYFAIISEFVLNSFGFKLAIFLNIKLDTLHSILNDLAPIYGVIVSLVAIFAIYKRGRICNKLDKYTEEFKKIEIEWGLSKIDVQEEEIINRYDEIFPKLNENDKLDADACYRELIMDSENREQLTLHLVRFIKFHFLLFLVFIAFSLTSQMEFLKESYYLIFDFFLVLFIISLFIIYMLGKVIKA